jgi:putative transposase
VLVRRVYGYRIYPNKEQREQFERTFGCVRFYWNKALEIAFNALKENGRVTVVLPSKLKKEYEFLKEIDSMALCNAQMQRFKRKKINNRIQRTIITII